MAINIVTTTQNITLEGSTGIKFVTNYFDGEEFIRQGTTIVPIAENNTEAEVLAFLATDIANETEKVKKEIRRQRKALALLTALQTSMDYVEKAV